MLAFGYTIGKRIGSGSYSKVYDAKRVRRSIGNAAQSGKHKRQRQPLQTDIACKVIDTRRTSKEYMCKFLPREMDIVKRLQHPYIVTVYTILEVGPFMCYIMDLCPLGDLLERIRSGGPLRTTVARLYFSQLTAAVHHLHKLAGCAHRDIKCDNVLLYTGDCIKLTDFGFARSLTPNRTSPTSHHLETDEDIEFKNIDCCSETFCGSAAYAAPEVLKGIPYDPRCIDMWSLGCVLYIMLTANMPYDDENIAATIRQQEQRIIYYPSDDGGNVGMTTANATRVPDEVRNLIARLLEPNVEIRLTVEQLLLEPWIVSIRI